jgi:hypothetical protein
MSNVIDIKPRLIARRKSECKHRSVLVGMTEAVLECETCGAALDPWWYIRREATEAESVIEGANRLADAKLDECNKAIATTNETLRRLNAEVEALNATRNRLANEVVNGQRVGSSVRGRRKL